MAARHPRTIYPSNGAGRGHPGGSISLQIAKKFRQILKILPEELNSTLARSHWIISKIHTFSHTFRTRDSQTAPEVVSMVPSSYQHLLATVRVPVARPERLWKPIRPPATPGQYTLRMERGGGFQRGVNFTPDRQKIPTDF